MLNSHSTPHVRELFVGNFVVSRFDFQEPQYYPQQEFVPQEPPMHYSEGYHPDPHIYVCCVWGGSGMGKWPGCLWDVRSLVLFHGSTLRRHYTATTLKQHATAHNRPMATFVYWCHYCVQLILWGVFEESMTFKVL